MGHLTVATKSFGVDGMKKNAATLHRGIQGFYLLLAKGR